VKIYVAGTVLLEQLEVLIHRHSDYLYHGIGTGGYAFVLGKASRLLLDCGRTSPNGRTGNFQSRKDGKRRAADRFDPESA
jgi:hypothetical protein